MSLRHRPCRRERSRGLPPHIRRKLVAEGVETSGPLETLRAFDCGQGFLFFGLAEAA
jgi:hypothetical protein